MRREMPHKIVSKLEHETQRRFANNFKSFPVKIIATLLAILTR